MDWYIELSVDHSLAMMLANLISCRSQVNLSTVILNLICSLFTKRLIVFTFTLYIPVLHDTLLIPSLGMREIYQMSVVKMSAFSE